MSVDFTLPHVKTSWRYNLSSATLAFFGLGAWAWHVNTRDASEQSGAAWISALTQGCCSFLSALVMVQAVTWLYRHLPELPIRFLWPAVIVVIAVGTILSTAHWLVGTTNIVATITPGLTIAFCFNLLTTHKLKAASSFGSG